MRNIKYLILLIIILIYMMYLSLSLDKSLIRINELENQLQEKQETIDSQVRMLIELRDNCDCEWLYDFYLEYAEEVGAYE